MIKINWTAFALFSLGVSYTLTPSFAKTLDPLKGFHIPWPPYIEQKPHLPVLDSWQFCRTEGNVTVVSPESSKKFEEWEEPGDGPNSSPRARIWETLLNPSTGWRGPIDITFSFPPEGTPITYNSGRGTGVNNLRGALHQAFGDTNRGLWEIRAAIARWSRHYSASGIMVHEVGDVGGAVPASPGARDAYGNIIRGEIRVVSFPFTNADGTPNGDYAYAYFPAGINDIGYDLILNSRYADPTLGGATWSTYGGQFLRNLAGHELGHSFGLGHVIPNFNPSEPVYPRMIMQRSYLTGFEGPQHDDFQGIQRLYGDSLEHYGDAPRVLQPTWGDNIISNLSIDHFQESDLYDVFMPVGSYLTVAVQPVGLSYWVGPEGGSPYLRHSHMVNSLRFAVYDQNWSSLAVSTPAGLGQSTYVWRVPRPANGVARVHIVASSSNNDVQMYNINLHLSR